MSDDVVESLVEQRIAQLTEISERRNTLLRQMYNLMRKRTNVSATITIDDEDEDDLHVFLSKYDLQNNPETGYIGHLSENELFSLVSPEKLPSTSPTPTSSRARSVEQARRSLSRPAEMNFVKADPFADSDDELDIIRKSPRTPSQMPSRHKALPAPSEIPDGHVEGSTRDEQTFPHAMQSEETNKMQAAEGSYVPELPSTMKEVIKPADVMDVDDKQDVAPPSQLSSPQLVSTAAEPPVVVSPTAMERPETDQPNAEEEDNIDVVMEPTQEVPSEPAPAIRKSVLFSSPENAVPSKYSTPLVIPSLTPKATRFSTPEPFNLPSLSSPVYIPIPSLPYQGVPDYFNFPATTFDLPAATPISPVQPRHQLDLRYTLPPLDTLPADFRPKPKKAKMKKKDREKEKAEGKKDKEVEKKDKEVESKKDKEAEAKKEKDGKDDWVPWGLNRWNATIRTNPVYKRVAKATKCLSTRDWAVAMTELKLVRAVDRIELLKSNGRWSFRQPRKQRASGGITKTHWDYLMDEMKWMRTDFREERKWKTALAYNLSTSVLEWHAAGTPEKRLKRGICVHWKPPHQTELKDEIMQDVTDVSVDTMELEKTPPTETGSTRPSSALLNLDYGSDDEDDDDQEKEVDDGLDTSLMVEESFASLDQSISGEGIGFKDLEPKTEEVDDSSALQTDAIDIDKPPESETSTAPEDAASSKQTLRGLKSTSDDPLLADVSASTSVSSGTGKKKLNLKMNLYAPLRENIAHSDVDKLFLNLDDFRITNRDPSTDTLTETFLPPSDLSIIFPDVQMYGMLDVAPPTLSIDSKKKSSDKKLGDEMNKRMDEVGYSKLYPSNMFMLSKPTLVGALQPSKHMRDGQWVDLDATPISVEHEALQPTRLPDEFNHGIFEHKITPISIVTPAVPSVQPPPPSTPVPKFKEPSKRAIDHLWSAGDDLLLKSLAEKYPNNWMLIAECYNATRVTVKSDWRTSKDCQERWKERWSPAATLRLQEVESASEETPPPGAMSNTPVGPRGVKRLASASVGMSSTPTISTGSGSEPKKRRRHTMVQDAVRKSMKRRNEATQKNNTRKSAGMHESHNDFNNLVKMSPAEVSRRKAERDSQQNQELQVARARALAGPNGARTPQPAAVHASTTNGAQRPSAASAQPVAQIRQQVPISQQQRAATPLVIGATRMSPQQQQMLAQQVRTQQQQVQPQTGSSQSQAQALALSHALAQAQAAQTHSHSVEAQAAATLRGNLQQALSQNGTNGSAQLSPPYTSRDATSSPAHASPPRSTATPANGTVNSPRPPSAQAQNHPQVQGQSSTQHAQVQPVGMLQNGQITAMSIPQARNVQGHYYLPNVANYSPEQLQNVLRMQSMVQQHQQAQAQQQQQQQ